MPLKPKKDPRVDQYIKGAAPFAKPILIHLRKIVRACSSEIEETIKWDAPWFMFRNKVLCGVVTFKSHCALLFNNSKSLAHHEGATAEADLKNLRKIASRADLPTDSKLRYYVKQAMKLNEPGAKRLKRTIKKKPPVQTPTDLLAALRANPKTLAIYQGFVATNQRHYVDWLNDAKTDATREKRLEKAVECIAARKIRHWL